MKNYMYMDFPNSKLYKQFNYTNSYPLRLRK